MKILIVLTSHQQLGDTGEPTGFWLEELAAPYYAFKEAGASLTLASPSGGRPPLDPKSAADDAQTDATRRFQQDDEAQAALSDTQRLAEVEPGGFDALFYPGGHGPLWDLSHDPTSLGLIEGFARAAKPVAAVCHAPAVLLNATSAAGEPLIAGKRVTGFSNSEEAAVGLSEVVPFLLEDRLRELGGSYERAEDDWAPHVVCDGDLITGQNPASSEGAAQALIARLSG